MYSCFHLLDFCKGELLFEVSGYRGEALRV
jgi:hypothetical protein